MKVTGEMLLRAIEPGMTNPLVAAIVATGLVAVCHSLLWVLALLIALRGTRPHERPAILRALSSARAGQARGVRGRRSPSPCPPDA